MTPNVWDAVHHFVPAVYPNDAIGGHVVRTAAAQRDRGRRSEIFVEVMVAETADLCHHVADLDQYVIAGERTLLVYHSATGSALPSVLAARPETLVVQHHSLTPIDLIAPWSPDSVTDLAVGRRQLEQLARRAELGLGDSAHNVRELETLGFQRTTVVPVMLRSELVPSDAEPRAVADDPIVLFVGRIAANKAQHDLIKALAALRVVRPTAKLRLVGAVASPRYQAALEKLVNSLHLRNSVTFTGSISDDELDIEYRQADVFCCLSDHEGFGVPLIEAAHHTLPVVAYDAAAVAETVGRGGLILAVKDPATVATALDRALGDVALRRDLVVAANRRLAELEPAIAAERFNDAILALADSLDGADVRGPEMTS